MRIKINLPTLGRLASLGAPLDAEDEPYTDLQDYYLDEASKRQ